MPKKLASGVYQSLNYSSSEVSESAQRGKLETAKLQRSHKSLFNLLGKGEGEPTFRETADVG